MIILKFFPRCHCLLRLVSLSFLPLTSCLATSVQSMMLPSKNKNEIKEEESASHHPSHPSLSVPNPLLLAGEKKSLNRKLSPAGAQLIFVLEHGNTWDQAPSFTRSTYICPARALTIGPSYALKVSDLYDQGFLSCNARLNISKRFEPLLLASLQKKYASALATDPEKVVRIDEAQKEKLVPKLLPRLTQEEGEKIFYHYILRDITWLFNHLPPEIHLNQQELDVCCSLLYNIGKNNFMQSDFFRTLLTSDTKEHAAPLIANLGRDLRKKSYYQGIMKRRLLETFLFMNDIIPADIDKNPNQYLCLHDRWGSVPYEHWEALDKGWVDLREGKNQKWILRFIVDSYHAYLKKASRPTLKITTALSFRTA